MTQDDFKFALRSLAAGQLPPAPTAHAIARQLLRRDRRRTRVFAFLTILFWTLGTAGLLWLVFALNRFVIFLRIAPGLPWSPAPLLGQVADRRNAFDYMIWGTNLLHHSIPYVFAATACLILAALFTVLLISSSRQATLNRINLSLAEIAEQIRHAGLAPALPSSELPSGPNPTGEMKGSLMRTVLIVAILLAAGIIASAILYTAHPTPSQSSTFSRPAPEPQTAGPWQSSPRLSPFHAVRYPAPDALEVQISGTWYSLLSLNGINTADLISICQNIDPNDWQKRLEEDLIEVLTRAGHTPPSLATASLKLTNLTTHQTTTQDIPMTKENRRALWESRNVHAATRPDTR